MWQWLLQRRPFSCHHVRSSCPVWRVHPPCPKALEDSTHNPGRPNDAISQGLGMRLLQCQMRLARLLDRVCTPCSAGAAELGAPEQPPGQE